MDMKNLLRIVGGFGSLVLAGELRANPAPPTLEERVQGAKELAIVTLVEREPEPRGDWVQGVVRIDTSIRGSAAGSELPVIWPAGAEAGPSAVEGRQVRGIAVLSEQVRGRYRLGRGRWLGLDQLARVMRLVAAVDREVPGFEAWLAAGKPLPEGMNFTGGSIWFDESTGKQREPRAVYDILYGRRPGTSGKRIFPADWGTPPRRQTRDLRPLPGGYGHGSGTLAKWIADKLGPGTDPAAQGE
jgi:hypothetical protein